jgi:hypothetical protein
MKKALNAAAQVDSETLPHRLAIAKKYLSTSFKEIVENDLFRRALENQLRNAPA